MVNQLLVIEAGRMSEPSQVDLWNHRTVMDPDWWRDPIMWQASGDCMNPFLPSVQSQDRSKNLSCDGNNCWISYQSFRKARITPHTSILLLIYNSWFFFYNLTITNLNKSQKLRNSSLSNISLVMIQQRFSPHSTHQHPPSDLQLLLFFMHESGGNCWINY